MPETILNSHQTEPVILLVYPSKNETKLWQKDSIFTILQS